MSAYFMYWEACLAACVTGLLICLHINRMTRATPFIERAGAILIAAACFAKSSQWLWGDYLITWATALMFNGSALYGIAISRQRLVELGYTTGRFFGRRQTDRRAI